MLTHDRSKRKAASLCHESLRYILYIIWGSLTNLKIAFFWHQKYTKLHHSKVWNIQTREMNTAFSSHNVTGFKGYLPRSPSSYPVRVVWNDNEAKIIYMLSTRGAKRGSNYIYFRFQSLSLPLSMFSPTTPVHGNPRPAKSHALGVILTRLSAISRSHACHLQ